ncbi:hypothetical protein LINPERHAP2_LOCUS12709, partial [Linum perenne]
VYNPQLVAILEPRVSGRVGSEVRKKLGFKFSNVVEARGFGGGIWILWNDPNLNFTALSSSTQFTHFRVQNDLGESCLTTVVYAAPNLMGRRVLWQDLKGFSNSISEPWLLGYGAKFTWFRGRLKERIDRALCNDHWLRAFQNAQTYHVERIKSDHRPLLVRLSSSSISARPPRPFRFNAAWLGHDLFPSFLDQSWTRGRDFVSSLQGFQDCCLSWNKDVFGHIFKRKRTLEKCLRWLEHMSDSDRDGRLANEEDSVRIELEKMLWQEQMLWLQKSRLQWLKDGDRNTKFFHLSTIMRRKSNQIKGLKLSDGSWIYGEAEMQEAAVKYFRELFAAAAAINGEITENPRHEGTLLNIRELRHRNWETVVSHTFREGNVVADLLAHHGHLLNF